MATIKAKRAAKIKLENPKKPMGQVMLEAGFTKSSSEHPSHLTESKGWNELMQEYLPDNLLGERHREFLMGERIVRKYVKGDLEIETEETDPSAVKALDMAYKLKGRYGADVNVQALIVQVPSAVAKKYGINPSTGGDNK